MLLSVGDAEIRHQYSVLEDDRHPYGLEGGQACASEKYHHRRYLIATSLGSHQSNFSVKMFTRVLV